METITEAPDESTGDSNIVKSEDGSAQQDGGRYSPPPNCAICLGRCRNKSFTDSCLHQFCFKCLLTWSRVKTECPLCKQNFKSIIHNVKSNHQYEEYPVEQPQEVRPPTSLDINEIVNAARRFRYRTTLTLPRRETLAIQQFLMHYPLAALVNDLPPRAAHTPAASRDRGRRSPADFRRTVYRHNLWARPLPDFTGRFRDCSPEFFRYNDSQIHRLMPWLNRELYYLLNENTGHISYVMGRILELLPQHPIISPEFHAAMHCYFGDRTDHFLHEFHCFASTPYDITGYDRHVQYQTDARVSAVVDEVLSSSDSDRDSDIVVVSSSHPAPASAPGPSHAPGPSYAPGPSTACPSYPRGRLPPPDVVPIETISHDSDSDSSEVMVVGYIKPPHQRTPELVDLLGSDSDVVVQETSPAPAAGSPLVRLTLSQPRPRRPLSIEAHAGSGSEDQSYTLPPPPMRRRRRSLSRTSDPPMTVSPPPPPVSPPPTPTPPPPPTISSTSSLSPYVSPSSTPPLAAIPLPVLSYKTPKPTISNGDASTDESDDDYDAGRRRKPRRKTTKVTPKTDRRSHRRKERNKSEDRSKREPRHTGKSKNGKGVKSSKVVLEKIPLPTVPAGDQAGPSMSHGRNKRRTSENAPRRGCRESKRLKSVVSVMKRDSSSSAEAHSSPDSSKSRSNRVGGSSSRRRRRQLSIPINRYDSDSSSDDNIPLHLTIPRAEDKKRFD